MGGSKSHQNEESRRPAWRREYLGRDFQAEQEGVGQAALIPRAESGYGLAGWSVLGLSSWGKDWPATLSPRRLSSPQSPSQHPPPTPHLSQSKDWKIDASVYGARNVASENRHSAEPLGASNGTLFMSFSFRRWSHYRPGWCSVTLHSPSDAPMSG